MTEAIDFDAMNRQVIKEFRETGGKAGGIFEGKPLVLVHHTGAKSGKERIAPLVPLIDDGRARGLDLTYDTYPYLAGSTILGMVALPAWVQEGGIEPTLERLADGAIGVIIPVRKDLSHARQSARRHHRCLHRHRPGTRQLLCPSRFQSGQRRG